MATDWETDEWLKCEDALVKCARYFNGGGRNWGECVEALHALRVPALHTASERSRCRHYASRAQRDLAVTFPQRVLLTLLTGAIGLGLLHSFPTVTVRQTVKVRVEGSTEHHIDYPTEFRVEPIEVR